MDCLWETPRAEREDGMVSGHMSLQTVAIPNKAQQMDFLWETPRAEREDRMVSGRMRLQTVAIVNKA